MMVLFIFPFEVILIKFLADWSIFCYFLCRCYGGKFAEISDLLQSSNSTVWLESLPLSVLRLIHVIRVLEKNTLEMAEKSLTNVQITTSSYPGLSCQKSNLKVLFATDPLKG
jgi:hypothetical protein